MEIVFDTSGFNRLTRIYAVAESVYKQFLRDFLHACGLKLREYTVQNTNVGIHGSIYGMTGGTLRRSWKLTPITEAANSMKITLFADPRIAYYAIYVEEGHRTVAYSPTTGKRIYFQLPDGSWRASKNGWVEGQHMARNAIERVEREMQSAYNTAFARFEDRLRELARQ